MEAHSSFYNIPFFSRHSAGKEVSHRVKGLVTPARAGLFYNDTLLGADKAHGICMGSYIEAE